MGFVVEDSWCGEVDGSKFVVGAVVVEGVTSGLALVRVSVWGEGGKTCGMRALCYRYGPLVLGFFFCKCAVDAIVG